uniref:CBM20 domain-containing protein n=1 Tax=Chromera velia CCMP2878 TaxID=1169474 RepID=A0A0G4HF98_9ALVE|eukprot:Cvel_26881.t1-p1 / transcript=Cvel_26881.t1 / gene=Cvel_26881 / organism=Chromera_velia_CCMP2878 / gene_product=hypothetical protein / transcript_product=hypothetical protein / location=Cvel_scaffold3267:3696-17222(+) / protein_length=1917 / sequence_SO=supercontig / SO=protein_coding / is_pseudo=false
MTTLPWCEFSSYSLRPSWFQNIVQSDDFFFEAENEDDVEVETREMEGDRRQGRDEKFSLLDEALADLCGDFDGEGGQERDWEIEDITSRRVQKEIKTQERVVEFQCIWKNFTRYATWLTEEAVWNTAGGPDALGRFRNTKKYKDAIIREGKGQTHRSREADQIPSTNEVKKALRDRAEEDGGSGGEDRRESRDRSTKTKATKLNLTRRSDTEEIRKKSEDRGAFDGLVAEERAAGCEWKRQDGTGKGKAAFPAGGGLAHLLGALAQGGGQSRMAIQERGSREQTVLCSQTQKPTRRGREVETGMKEPQNLFLRESEKKIGRDTMLPPSHDTVSVSAERHKDSGAVPVSGGGSGLLYPSFYPFDLPPYSSVVGSQTELMMSLNEEGRCAGRIERGGMSNGREGGEAEEWYELVTVVLDKRDHWLVCDVVVCKRKAQKWSTVKGVVCLAHKHEVPDEARRKFAKEVPLREIHTGNDGSKSVVWKQVKDVLKDPSVAAKVKEFHQKKELPPYPDVIEEIVSSSSEGHLEIEDFDRGPMGASADGVGILGKDSRQERRMEGREREGPVEGLGCKKTGAFLVRFAHSHNLVDRGEKWMSMQDVVSAGGSAVLRRFLLKKGVSRDQLPSILQKQTGLRILYLRKRESRSEVWKDCLVQRSIEDRQLREWYGLPEWLPPQWELFRELEQGQADRVALHSFLTQKGYDLRGSPVAVPRSNGGQSGNTRGFRVIPEHSRVSSGVPDCVGDRGVEEGKKRKPNRAETEGEEEWEEGRKRKKREKEVDGARTEGEKRRNEVCRNETDRSHEGARDRSALALSTSPFAFTSEYRAVSSNTITIFAARINRGRREYFISNIRRPSTVSSLPPTPTRFDDSRHGSSRVPAGDIDQGAREEGGEESTPVAGRGRLEDGQWRHLGRLTDHFPLLREFHTENHIPIAPQRPVRVVDSRGKTQKDICFKVEVCVEWNLECLREDLRLDMNRWIRVADLFSESPGAFDLVETYLKTARLRWPPLIDLTDPLELLESRQIGEEADAETEYLTVFALNPLFVRPPPKKPNVASGTAVGHGNGETEKEREGLEGYEKEVEGPVPHSEAVSPSVCVHLWRRRDSLPTSLVERFGQMGEGTLESQKEEGKVERRGKVPASGESLGQGECHRSPRQQEEPSVGPSRDECNDSCRVRNPIRDSGIVFASSGVEVAEGHEVMVIGNRPELGSWDVTRGVPLTAKGHGECCVWVSEPVELRALTQTSAAVSLTSDQQVEFLFVSVPSAKASVRGQTGQGGGGKIDDSQVTAEPLGEVRAAGFPVGEWVWLAGRWGDIQTTCVVADRREVEEMRAQRDKEKESNARQQAEIASVSPAESPQTSASAVARSGRGREARFDAQQQPSPPRAAPCERSCVSHDVSCRDPKVTLPVLPETDASPVLSVSETSVYSAPMLPQSESPVHNPAGDSDPLPCGGVGVGPPCEEAGAQRELTEGAEKGQRGDVVIKESTQMSVASLPDHREDASEQMQVHSDQPKEMKVLDSQKQTSSVSPRGRETQQLSAQHQHKVSLVDSAPCEQSSRPQNATCRELNGTVSVTTKATEAAPVLSISETTRVSSPSLLPQPENLSDSVGSSDLLLSGEVGGGCQCGENGGMQMAVEAGKPEHGDVVMKESAQLSVNSLPDQTDDSHDQRKIDSHQTAAVPPMSPDAVQHAQKQRFTEPPDCHEETQSAGVGRKRGWEDVERVSAGTSGGTGQEPGGEEALPIERPIQASEDEAPKLNPSANPGEEPCHPPLVKQRRTSALAATRGVSSRRDVKPWFVGEKEPAADPWWYELLVSRKYLDAASLSYAGVGLNEFRSAKAGRKGGARVLLGKGKSGLAHFGGRGWYRKEVEGPLTETGERPVCPPPCELVWVVWGDKGHPLGLDSSFPEWPLPDCYLPVSLVFCI